MPSLPRDARSETRRILASLPDRPETAWPALLGRVESRLRVLLSFRGCDEPDDVLQEVWVEAIASIGRFEYRGPGSLQRWLAGIARNKVRERARGLRRAAVVAAGEGEPAADGAPAGLCAALADARAGVTTVVRERELEDRVRAALAQLAEDEREVLLLRLYEGLGVREAGARLGVDPSTVSLRMKRALRRCSVLLGPDAP